MWNGRYCWLCGRNGMGEPLDKHHIFGKHAVHNDPEAMRRLHQYGQRKAMAEQGWSVQDFIREFGKNYLEDEA